MSTVIVEIAPNDFVRLPKEEAEKLGLKEVTLKPVLPESNKKAKPSKTKKVEPKVEAVVDEVTE